MFDERLGYDPEEWEECPEQEHFLVFGFFTRFFISAFAIAFAYYFFKLVDQNKNKGKEKEEEEVVPVTSEVLEEASRRLQSVAATDPSVDFYRPPSSADALLQEASQYLSENLSNGRDNSPRRFVEAQIEYDNQNDSQERPVVPPHRDTVEVEKKQQQQDVEDQLHIQQHQPMSAHPGVPEVHVKRDVESEVQDMHRIIREQLTKQNTFEETKQPELFLQETKPSQTYMSPPHFEEAFLTQSSAPRTPAELAEKMAQGFIPPPHFEEVFLTQSSTPGEPMGADKASMGCMQAPHFDEAFVTQTSAPRTPEGGEKKSMGGYMQAPHYDEAFQTQTKSPIEIDVQQPQDLQASPKISPRTDLSAEDQRALREWEWELAQLEADRLAKLQDREVGGEESELNLTNLLPATHISFRTSSSPNGQAEAPAAERRLKEVARQAIRDSDLTDYDISDFHAIEGSLPPPVGDDYPVLVGAGLERRRTTGDSEDYVKVSAEPIYDEPPRNDKPMTTDEARQLMELCQEYDFGADVVAPAVTLPMRPAHMPAAQPGGAPSKGTPQEPFQPQKETTTTDFRGPSAPAEDLKNKATADIFVQDALEYLNQQEAGPASGFVIEEEMLSSHNTQNRKAPLAVSGDPTSALVRTADVFERIEHDEHDDMTYAPEIQSVEIPPDQLSENSENLLEYFDRTSAVAAENAPQHPAPQAPSIVSASQGRAVSSSSLASGLSSDGYPRLRKQSSLLSVLNVTSMQEMLLTITSLESLTEAMRKAGLSRTNVIFGIDYTASNKYQGEESFGGRSLHTIHPSLKNPYQQVISILGRTLSPFTATGCFPAFGFGDARTGDWSVFPLKHGGQCNTIDEVLKTYNQVTPNVDLSGPTNFAPLIHQAMEICQKSHDYHILVIIADGQVTNERATRRAIVQACQYPLSIIVVGVGDGPWDMMRVFDESLPKRPWDNFHFVEFNEIMKKMVGRSEADVQFAVQSLLEIPDQYRCICELGLLRGRAPPPRGSEIRKEMQT